MILSHLIPEHVTTEQRTSNIGLIMTMFMHQKHRPINHRKPQSSTYMTFPYHPHHCIAVWSHYQLSFIQIIICMLWQIYHQDKLHLSALKGYRMSRFKIPPPFQLWKEFDTSTANLNMSWQHLSKSYIWSWREKAFGQFQWDMLCRWERAPSPLSF